MNKRSLTLVLTMMASLALPAAARADWGGHHYYPGYYRPHSGFEFIISQPRPVCYVQQPQPVYVSQPVYVNQPVYYQQPQMTENGYCREFTRTSYVGGRPQQGYGNACMQPDGSWQMVD